LLAEIPQLAVLGLSQIQTIITKLETR